MGGRAALLSKRHLVLVLGHFVFLGDNVEVRFRFRILFEFLRRFFCLLSQNTIRPGQFFVFFLRQGESQGNHEVVT